MPLRVQIVLGLAVLALAVPAAATAKVRLVYVTSPINQRAQATLVVAVPAKKTCSIIVHYKSGPSEASGLSPKKAIAGKIAWTWMVGSNTTAGRWPIYIECG